MDNIISTKCPRLNKLFRNKSVHASPDLEVVIRYDNKGNPIAVQCGEYDKYETPNCKIANLGADIGHQKCIYSFWREFNKE